MTQAPDRPLQHSHLGDENPFELISSPFGVLERWRAVALQTGSLGAMTALSKHVRNDAVGRLDEVAERERVVTERERAADARDRAFRDAVGKFFDRATPFVDRAEQARADQQREPEEPLARPLGEQPADETHVPTGDLHSAPPKEDPEQDTEQDTRGEFLRLKGDQTEFPDPELAHPPAVQQPVAAGLDQTP